MVIETVVLAVSGVDLFESFGVAERKNLFGGGIVYMVYIIN